MEDLTSISTFGWYTTNNNTSMSSVAIFGWFFDLEALDTTDRDIYNLILYISKMLERRVEL